MKGIIYIASIVSVLIIVALIIINVTLKRGVFDLSENIILSFATGIFGGFISSKIYQLYEKEKRLETIKNELGNYVGHYKVYHWRDLINPDECGYEVTINLDDEKGILKIDQTGKKDVDILIAEVKIDEFTFNYGEGNYIHPKKLKNPTGRMQLYLVTPGTINVDKHYLHDKNDSEFIPAWEKWQWRKLSYY